MYREIADRNLALCSDVEYVADCIWVVEKAQEAVDDVSNVPEAACLSAVPEYRHWIVVERLVD